MKDIMHIGYLPDGKIDVTVIDDPKVFANAMYSFLSLCHDGDGGMGEEIAQSVIIAVAEWLRTDMDYKTAIGYIRALLDVLTMDDAELAHNARMEKAAKSNADC